MKRILFLSIFLSVFLCSKSQNLSYTCPRDTILGCNTACFTIKARFPDVRDLGTNYTFENATPVSVCRPYDPPDVVGPSTNLDIDDHYSAVIPIGFNFPFYGTSYPSLVVSTNGYLSFDITLAGAFAAWTLSGNVPSTGYDPALVMGPWHDLDPSPTITTSPDEQIKYNLVGTAPNRKWVLSFYKVPQFQCNDLIENTHQIVLHETTGVIEVFIFDKQVCSTWNSGKAMVGLQDMTQTKGIVPPGRGAADPPWGSVGMNEVWRFIPTGGAPLYRSVQLLNSVGAVVATGDTTRVNVNTFETSFPNVCPPAGASLYVVKTTYQKPNGAAGTIYSLDTINVIRQAALPVTATMTQTACGLNTGTITASAAGTPGYQYSVDGGTLQPSNIFLNMGQGPHTVYAIDATGCNNTINITVTSISSLTNTVAHTNTSCPGINDGTVTVTPTAGTAPYTYSIDGGVTTQPGGVFSGLDPGIYTVTFTDINGCTGTATAQTVNAGTGITSTLSNNTGTSCNGISDGSVTVTPTSGTGPYTYSVDGGAAQPGNVLTGLSSGSHTITITDLGSGCTGTKNVTIAAGSGLNGTFTSTPTSCPGVNNATITITPTNGIAPYTYSLDGGPFLPGPITGVSSAVHTVTIKDANGCTGNITVVTTSGSGITASAVATPSACSGVNNGVLTITTSGTAPYSYSFNAGVTYTPMVGNTITGLAPGAYAVIIKDVNGCRASININIPAGTTIAMTTSSTAASCPGVNNATITVTPTTGTAPYSYSLDGGVTYQPLVGNLISGVGSGVIAVMIKDANGCTGTVNVNVAAGAAITGTTSGVATSCTEASNGSVTVTATSGDAPYTYSIDGGAFQVSNIFSGLTSGAHTVTIKDANGCTGNVAVNITAGPGITGTATSVATSCPGVNNGSVTVTPTTGTSPYTYSIDGGSSQAGNIFNSLAAGPHTVTFQDANGCVGTSNVTVTAGTAITATSTSVATSCPGVNNGSVTVTPVTGTAPFTYSIDGGLSQAGNTFNNQSSGAHIVTFQDANGCVGTKNVTVTSGAVIAATSTSIATSCPGVNNGSVTVTPTTGTAPYTYSIDGSASQAGNTFTGLSSGAHMVTFQDANGCVGTRNVNIPAGAGITGTATGVATSCPGISNGSVTVTPATGTAPYTYSIDGGAFQPGNTFTGLASGAHIATFQDANGCIGTVNINVGPGVGITGTAAAVATGCPGVNNGSLTVTPTTGTAPYTYSIDGGPAQPGAIFNGLATGLHTATFTDANGCSGTASATVNTGNGLTSEEEISGTSCPGVDNGSVTVTPGTGTAPYLYSIDGGSTQPGNSFSNLTSGSHSIRFTDALGCVGTKTITIPAGVNLTSTVAPVNPPCANINDGSITVTPTTGAAPYMYSIDGGITTQASPTFTNLAPGPYTIIFTDAIGCTGTKSSTLTTHTPVTTTIIFTKPLCNSNANGSIKLTPSGGVAPYEFSKDLGANYQASGIFTGLTAGIYSFRIRDNVGCIKDTTVTLTEPTLLTATTVSPSPATCNGNDGQIKITAGGGTPGYQYSINNGATYQSSNIFAVSSGNYPNILVKDNKGCTANAAINVTGIDNMFLNLGPDSTICAGQSLQFQPQTNAQTSIFHWTSADVLTPIPAGTIDNDTLKNATITPVDTFTYVLTAQWGVCPPKKDTIAVFVKHKPIVNAGADQAICFEDTTAILMGSATDLSGSVNYAWTPAEHLVTPSAPGTLAILNTTTQYTLTVTDNYGCNYSVTDDLLVSLQPPVPAFAGNDTIAVSNQPQQLMGDGGVTYEWTPSYPLNLSNVQYPIATLSHDQQFVVTVTDIAGCIGTDTVFIKVYNGPACYVPNAFTPNGDGLNDVFRVVPAGIAYTEWFRIFNRYGEMVFETNKWLQGWDGTYLGRKQPIGNYVWMLKGTDKNGKVIEMKGTVLLLQ